MENNEKIIQAIKLRKAGYSFREISAKLEITLQQVIHYCTDTKYRDFAGT